MLYLKFGDKFCSTQQTVVHKFYYQKFCNFLRKCADKLRFAQYYTKKVVNITYVFSALCYIYIKVRLIILQHPRNYADKFCFAKRLCIKVMITTLQILENGKLREHLAEEESLWDLSLLETEALPPMALGKAYTHKGNSAKQLSVFCRTLHNAGIKNNSKKLI